MFLGANRNKQEMVPDLKQKAAREIIYKLTKTADVMLENDRPGVSDRLQIGYAQLSAIDSRLISCSISGNGSRGALQARLGFNQVLQSMTGIAVSQGGEGAPQVQGDRWWLLHRHSSGLWRHGRPLCARAHGHQPRD